MTHRSHHTDDGHPGILRISLATLETFSQRLFIGPESSRSSFINNRSAWRVGVVTFAKSPSLAEREFHCPKVIWTDISEESPRSFGRTKRWLSFKAQAGVELVTTERKIVHSSHCLNTGNLGQTLDQLLLEKCLPFLVRILVFR